MSFKFNPFTGNFDIVSPDNFSYEVITKVVTVPLYQQMIVFDGLEIESNGTLNVNGTVILEDL